ncbi:SgcJ/EcaC family oxidoreductase [Mycolicibacterium boenickei]
MSDADSPRDGQAAQRGPAQSDVEEAAIRGVLGRLKDAWARHDAAAYAAEFTKDATYTTFQGIQYLGRDEIAESHRVLFARFLSGTRLADEVVAIRRQGNVAIVVGRGDTYKGRAARRLRKVQTFTLIRGEDGRWQVAAFHNTKRKVLTEFLTFRMEPRLKPGLSIK